MLAALATPHRIKQSHRRRRRIASGALDYNYFRDYEPGTGRYTQSDPIGLRGGINTYAYAGDDPLDHADPSGRQMMTSTDLCMGFFGNPNCGSSFQPPPQNDCDDHKCKHPVKVHSGGVCAPGDAMCPIAMRQAGIAGPYTYTTTTYDGECLAKFGLLKLAINAGENYGLKAAAAAGSGAVASAVEVLTSTPATTGFVLLAGYAVLQECKCPDEQQ